MARNPLFQSPFPPTTAIEVSSREEELSVFDQRTLYLVNIFIVNTTRFLNRFSAICEEKLADVHRILRLDATLTLLEVKLRSIDGVGEFAEHGGLRAASSNSHMPQNTLPTDSSLDPQSGFGEPLSAKLVDIYRNRHNISASSGLSDPAVATGISDLVNESTKPTHAEHDDTLASDLTNAWATNLDDGLWGNAPAMNREDDARSSGTSSPESTGSVETSISSHFGGMSYPSLFSSRPTGYGSSQQLESKTGASTSRFSNTTTGVSSSTYEGLGSPIREEPPSYTSSIMQRFESFENPLAGQSFGSQDEEGTASENPQFGKAFYDFTAGGDDEVCLLPFN
ncbi:uncharacterized protein LOC143890928 [Tasmannia lanceolata]|uniref:uncharacterized protein LOC143890928 n=1 Tax=Tasmannia lanceolata TaxID=3420 RepID=UPI0040642A0F